MTEKEICEFIKKSKESNRKTAKMLMELLPGKYKSLESARSSVRYILGKYGNKSRKYKKVDKDIDLYQPKYLVLDIETSPLPAWVWGAYKQNISINQIESDWFILSWAAKWLGDDNVMGEVISPADAKKHTDKNILPKLYKLVNDADVIIAHNGDKFDIKKIKLRFLVNNYKPPLPFQTIDTLKIWKKEFGSVSNKLDYLNQKVLKFEGKKETGGMQLWLDCLDGKKEALLKMLDYNKQDVVILEKNYIKIRGWAHSQPNYSLMTKDFRCSNCGNEKLIPVNATYRTQVNEFALYQCSNCGAFMKSFGSTIDSKTRKNIARTTAR